MVESIQSILPLCDEFVVAAGDSSDATTDLIRAIRSPKIRIVETAWDRSLYVRGAIFAQQTDLALDACRGDWAFYLQADEVIHERDLPLIAVAMRRYLRDPRVEGLLFDYLHFFGDYDHVQTSHNWYSREIRIVRTGIGVRSWHDAQGFRRDGNKLRVAHCGATVYHYGWVRPPRNLRRKTRAFAEAYEGSAPPAGSDPQGDDFRYGRLCGLRRFSGSHPAVMAERQRQMDWQVRPSPPAGYKHDRWRIRVLSFVENSILGLRVGERRNYLLLRGEDHGEPAVDWRRRLARYGARAVQ